MWLLIIMLLLLVIMGTGYLGVIVIQEMIEPPLLIIDPKIVFHSFGLFLIILVGLELMRLLKLHLSHERFKPELVVEVAIIALCSKIVTLDVKGISAGTLLGLAGLLLGLSVSYFAFTRTQRNSPSEHPNR